MTFARTRRYVFGQARNNRLEALGSTVLAQAQALAKGNDHSVRLLSSFYYQAASWAHPRRSICKAEVTDQGPNPRCVVTNLERSRASFIYRRSDNVLE